MRKPRRSGFLTLVVAAFVAGTSLGGAQRGQAQDSHDHASDRAGQVEQLQRMVLPPTEWQMDANLSADRARALSTYLHFGGLHTLTSAEVWVPNNPGVVLVVSRVVATNATESGLVDAVRTATQEFEMSVAATLDVRAQAMPPGGRQFIHSDTATEIRIEVAQVALGYQAQLVIARDAQRLEAVTTECIWADSDPANETSKAAAACRAALASTNATIVQRKRMPIVVPAVSGSGTDPATTGNRGSGDATETSAPSMSAGPRTSLSDNGKIVFPPMHIAPPAPPFNWRPWLFGVGSVIVLMALFLNHRHRQRLEALDGRPIRKPRGSKPPSDAQPPARNATAPAAATDAAAIIDQPDSRSTDAGTPRTKP